MKKRCVLVVAGSLLITGCNAGDSVPEGADPPDTAPTTIPEVPDERADGTTDVSESTPTTEVMDDTPAWIRLEELRSDPAVDELDVALAEFSALFAPVPGGPVVAGDDSLLGTATHVLEDLERLRDRLTAEQQAFIDEQVDAVFGDAATIHEFTLYPEAAALRGVRSPVAPELELAIRGVADSLISVLGGPPLKVHVVVVDGSSLGTAGAQNISLGPTSPIRRDYADDGLDVDCVMKIRDRPTGTAELRGIVVHELVHCWHFTRIGLDVDRLEATDDWMKEGVAAYVGEQVGGTTRFSEEWWTAYTVPQFDVDRAWPLYARTYDAIGSGRVSPNRRSTWEVSGRAQSRGRVGSRPTIRRSCAAPDAFFMADRLPHCVTGF